MRSVIKSTLGSFTILFIGLCFLLILSGEAGFAATAGDVNGSGIVDINDALLIARYVSGQTVTGFNAGVADVDCSGKPDIVDALLVARFSAGLINQFPCLVTGSPTSMPTSTPTPTSTPVVSGYIQNDTFFKDTSGNPIYSQGGGILKVGDIWYWYGVKYTEAPKYYANPTAKFSSSTFESFTCYSSLDLMHWKFERTIADRNTAGLANAGWVGRCGVAYCAATKKYVLVSQLDAGILFATCDSPDGTFTINRVQTDFPMFVNGGTGDQTVFQDDDGKAYVICSSKSGRANLYVAPLRSSDFCGIDTATRIYSGNGREGNCMFKYKGNYYFCSSDLHGWNASHCYVLQASHILGPYSAEYIMTDTDLSFCHTTQTGFFVTVTGAPDSFVIFCGDRWSDFAGNGLGYNQWCPVSFNGSTPVFNDVSQWTLNTTAGTWTRGPDNNYIHNGDFEADRVIVSAVTGWTNSGAAANYNGKQYAGNFILQHTGTATTSQIITGIPNGTYTFKAWVRSSGGQSSCYLFARNYGGAEIDLNINTSIPSWTQKILSSSLNVTNGKIEIGLNSVCTSGQWAQLDNLSLVKN